MAGRFVGRWKDRTASRRLCRPYRILFASIPILSVAVFALLVTEPSLIGVICDTLPAKIQTALRVFDAVVLPRSLSDLDPIGERMGTLLFQAAFLTETLLAMGGIVSIALMLTRLDVSGIDDDFSIAQFWIRLLIAFCSLLFRPAHFSNPSLAVNYVDKSGLFLLREGVIIAVGYYNVALMLTDALGRATRTYHGSASARGPVIPAAYNGTEPR